MGTLSGRLGESGRRWTAAGVLALLIAAAPALAGGAGNSHDHEAPPPGQQPSAGGAGGDHGTSDDHGQRSGAEGDGEGPGAADSGEASPAAPAPPGRTKQAGGAKHARGDNDSGGETEHGGRANDAGGGAKHTRGAGNAHGAKDTDPAKHARGSKHGTAAEETGGGTKHDGDAKREGGAKHDGGATRDGGAEKVGGGAKHSGGTDDASGRTKRAGGERIGVRPEQGGGEQAAARSGADSSAGDGDVQSGSSVGAPALAPSAPDEAPTAAAPTRTRSLPARVFDGAPSGKRRRAATRLDPLAGAPLAVLSPSLTAPVTSAQPAPPPGEHPRATARDDDRGSTQILTMVLDSLARTAAVVPSAVWGALGGLAALAALFFGVAVARDRRARQLTREREGLLANLEALESAVLPALPEALGGLALSVTSAPAANPIGGGDFHDAFALSRDRAAVIIGDVAGHGRQALADAQLVRHAVRAYLEAGLDPRAALAMTGTVVEEREEPLFASVIVAVHDRRDGTLTFASAGHEPPILVTEQGAGLPPVSGWSPPLGTGLETGRRQTSMPLPEGAAVCLLTDGVTEARSGGERIGVSRAIKWLSALGPGAMSSDVITRLRDEVDAPEDDATVCMLRALTPAAQHVPRIEEAVVEGGDPTYLVRFLRDCGLPLADAEEAGEALAAAPDGTRMIASVEIRGGRAVVELAPLRANADLAV